MEAPGAVRRPRPRLSRLRPPAGDGETGRGRGLGARPTPPTQVPPRRPRPSLVGAPAEPPALPPRRPRDPSWFLGDAASERDQLWSALLRAAGSDPSPAGDPLPPLPAAPGQDPRPGPECEAPPEVFRVGPRAFLWTPLPPAPGAAGGLARSSSLPCAAGRHPGSLSVSSASSPRLHPTPEPPADPSAEELPSGEEPPALESCPMCQAPFGSTMSQLDVDGHLAQCLLKAPRTWHGEVEPMDTACLALISPLICPCVHMAWLSVHHGCCVEMCPLKVPVGHRGRVSYVGSFLTSARGHRSLRLRSDALVSDLLGRSGWPPCRGRVSPMCPGADLWLRCLARRHFLVLDWQFYGSVSWNRDLPKESAWGWGAAIGWLR